MGFFSGHSPSQLSEVQLPVFPPPFSVLRVTSRVGGTGAVARCGTCVLLFGPKCLKLLKVQPPRPYLAKVAVACSSSWGARREFWSFHETAGASARRAISHDGRHRGRHVAQDRQHVAQPATTERGHMTQDQWGTEVQDELHQTMGANCFRNWIEPLILDGLGKVRALCADQFHGQLCIAELRRYDPGPRSIGSTRSVRRVRVRYGHGNPAARNPTLRSVKLRRLSRGPSRRGQMPRTSLNGHRSTRFTFDTFVVGKPNELAPPRLGAWPKAGLSPSTRSFSMAASDWARRT